MASMSAAEVFPYGKGGGPTTPAWGPPETASSKGEEDASQQQASLLEVLPFDLNLKSSLFSQQLFRCCDFAFNSQRQRDGRGPAVIDEEREFQTVDSKPMMRHKAGGVKLFFLMKYRMLERMRIGERFGFAAYPDSMSLLGLHARAPAAGAAALAYISLPAGLLPTVVLGCTSRGLAQQKEGPGEADNGSLQREDQGRGGAKARQKSKERPKEAAAAAAEVNTGKGGFLVDDWYIGCKEGRCKKKGILFFARCMQARYARIHARHRAFSEWSIQPTNDWVVLAEVPLQQLHKQQIETPRVTVEDIEWRGTLGVYSKQADKISSKLPVAMQNLSSNFYYYWVTTQDDEVISHYLLNGPKPVDVAATDQVLACLMAAPQSKYSWHLYITKIDNKLIIDKANGSIVDLLTVNETSTEPPMQDAENRLNRPAALGFEAVKINQNLRQQVLVPGEIAASYPPAPFVESGDTPATIAYRVSFSLCRISAFESALSIVLYRLFTIPPRAGPNTPRRSINLLTSVFLEIGR
ncbi:hypothetical protein Esti_006537 [Eimeria stiedai]